MQFNNTWKALLNPGGSNHYFETDAIKPFQVHAGDFSIVNAWWLSELCRLIYKKEVGETGIQTGDPTRNEILSRVQLEEYRFFNSGKSQCTIVKCKKKVKKRFAVLVFRGTSGTFENWIHNFNAFPARWLRGGLVHKGFKDIFDGIWDDIYKELALVKEPLFFTGHSLGAALATLAASLKPPKALYTFGSPRVGNAAFIDTLKGIPIYRVINSHDIVSSTPPSLLAFKFLHAGKPFYPNHHHYSYFNSTASKKNLSGPKKERFLRSDSRLNRWFPPPPKFLSDHAPINYSTSLQYPLWF